MNKIQVITVVSMLLLMVAVGCSSSDQAAIDKAVNATLEVGQSATDDTQTAPSSASEPTAEPTSTPEPDNSEIVEKYSSLSSRQEQSVTRGKTNYLKFGIRNLSIRFLKNHETGSQKLRLL